MDSKEYWEKGLGPKGVRKSSDDSETYGDFCRWLRETQKEIRSHQYDIHHAKIRELNIPFETKNAGHHLILDFGTWKADFWPASGKWFDREDSRYGMGLHRLLERL